MTGALQLAPSFLLVALILAPNRALAETFTIPCSRVDEFLNGGIEVPPRAEVRVTGQTLRNLVERLGAETVARLYSTPQGREALRQQQILTEDEFAWCQQRVQNELDRRQRARQALERSNRENADPRALGIAVIPFTPGRPIVVDALVNDTPARLILDTGADSTVIAPRVLRAASALPLGKTARMRGVTGEVTVEMYAVVALNVGGVTANALSVFAHDADRATDGLLGRDFLGRFLVTVDSAAGRVTLRQRLVDRERELLEQERFADDWFFDQMRPRSSR